MSFAEAFKILLFFISYVEIRTESSTFACSLNSTKDIYNLGTIWVNLACLSTSQST
jgi:hypothetical protein